MRAGRLRQRVTIQQATETQNAYGEMAQAWSTVGVIWADVRPMMGQAREQLAGGSDILQARAPYQVRMRYLEGLSPVSHRLVWDSRTLEVEAALDPDGRRHEMVAMCYEVQAAGAITGLSAGRLPALPRMIWLNA